MYGALAGLGAEIGRIVLGTAMPALQDKHTQYVSDTTAKPAHYQVLTAQDQRDLRKGFGSDISNVVALVAENAVGSAEAAQDAYGAIPPQLPSDFVLKQYMSQPVEKTLEGTGVVYVNDGNYDKEVFGADKPVMVLFYSDNPSTSGNNPSRGLTALARVLADQFPQIKLCAYKIANTSGMINQARINEVAAMYPLKDTPALLFYDNDKGKNEKIGALDGGIKTLGFLKNSIGEYSKNIIKYVLD